MQISAIKQANLRSKFPILQVCMALLAAAALALPGLASAADTPTYSLVLKDHKFNPQELTVPANTRIILEVTNNDKSVEEFESHDLKVEKIVAAGRTIKVRVGPLKPGRYKFEGEFHAATAQGVLIAE